MSTTTVLKRAALQAITLNYYLASVRKLVKLMHARARPCQNGAKLHISATMERNQMPAAAMIVI